MQICQQVDEVGLKIIFRLKSIFIIDYCQQMSGHVIKNFVLKTFHISSEVDIHVFIFCWKSHRLCHISIPCVLEHSFSFLFGRLSIENDYKIQLDIFQDCSGLWETCVIWSNNVDRYFIEGKLVNLSISVTNI